MNTVFVNIGLSLDGYMAPDGMTMGKPEYKNWGAKWGALMAWLISQQYFREKLKIGPGGETGPVNDMVRHTFERTGANIMGSVCSTKARSVGQKRLHFTRQCTFLPTSNETLGCVLAERRFTSSMRGLSVRCRWLGRLLVVVTFAFQEARM